MAYVINSEKGKKTAENMAIGSKYTASDGSTWEKKGDGSISVTTSKGEVFDNAYTPSSNKNSPYTGSSTGVQTYNTSQEAIKNQMNQNSIDWWSADDEEKKRLANENKNYAEKLGGNVSFDPDTGTWSGDAANNITPKSDIQNWDSNYTYTNPKPTTPKSDSRIDTLLDEILNRKDFSYDAESDPLYQQYREMYQREGDRATRDTLAEVASGAGGMNSYAVTAAQQANSYYNSQLNDKIPELYQLAYDMYLNDKESMVQDLGLLQSMDDTQYNRYRDTMSDYYNDRNFAYGTYMDAVQQGNWQTNFDYNAMWDEKTYNNENNWKEREHIANRADVDFDKNNYNRESAENQIMYLMDMGVTPNDELIAQAGWTKADVEQYAATKRSELALKGITSGGGTVSGGTTSGGSSGGSGKSGGSSSGSGKSGSSSSGTPAYTLDNNSNYATIAAAHEDMVSKGNIWSAAAMAQEAKNKGFITQDEYNILLRKNNPLLSAVNSSMGISTATIK